MICVLLACSGPDSGGFKLGIEDGPPQIKEEDADRVDAPGAEGVVTREGDMSAERRDGAMDSSPDAQGALVGERTSSADHRFGSLDAPTREHLEHAQREGMPLLTPEQKIAGPFEGPYDALSYIDPEGRVTIYIPTFHTVYFAQLQSGHFKWLYGASLGGYFAFDQDNDYVALETPPAKLVSWPLARDAAQQIANFATLYIDEQERVAKGAPPSGKTSDHRELGSLSSQEREVFWASMYEMTDAFAALNEEQIAKIGGRGCVAHYPYAYYIGCY